MAFFLCNNSSNQYLMECLLLLYSDGVVNILTLYASLSALFAFAAKVEAYLIKGNSRT